MRGGAAVSPVQRSRRRRAWLQLGLAAALPVAAVLTVGAPPVPTASVVGAAEAPTTSVLDEPDAAADTETAEGVQPPSKDAMARTLEAELDAAARHHDEVGSFVGYPATLEHALDDDTIVAVAVDDRGCRYAAILDGRRTGVTVDRTGRACTDDALQRLREQLAEG